ncbi:hypothetical protein EJB05_50383, partial [Eragrostis curvula]
MACHGYGLSGICHESEKLAGLAVTEKLFTSCFPTNEKLAGLAVTEHCPKIVAWAGQCRERGSVAKALADPDKVLQFLRSKLGEQ